MEAAAPAFYGTTEDISKRRYAGAGDPRTFFGSNCGMGAAGALSAKPAKGASWKEDAKSIQIRMALTGAPYTLSEAFFDKDARELRVRYSAGELFYSTIAHLRLKCRPS